MRSQVGVRVRVSLGEGSEPRMDLSPELIGRLDLRPGQSAHVRFGQRRSEVLIGVRFQPEGPEEAIQLTKSACDRLHLPPGIELTLSLDDDGRRLRLGPVIGVLALRGAGGNTFIGQGAYFRKLLAMARREGTVAYVFTPQDIRWRRRAVLGRMFIPGKGWRRRRLPLPDIVYNRIQLRRYERRRWVRRVKARLARRGIAFINPAFLDKWRTYRRLRRSRRVRRLLPATRLLRRQADLRRMIGRYPVVYVKPVDGSRGVGIWVIRRGRRPGRFRYRYYGAGATQDQKGLRPLQIWRRLRPVLRKRRLIVQRGLPLARVHGCPFDMRVLVQKDADGDWVVSGIYARLGKPGSYRSNITSGGRIRRVHHVLKALFGDRAERVLDNVKEAALLLAQRLERASPYALGELGFDIGVDRRGRPWMIEVNSKPVRRWIASSPGAQASLRRPLEYARRLAGFPS